MSMTIAADTPDTRPRTVPADAPDTRAGTVRRVSALEIVLAGLLASPAAAFTLLAGERGWRRRRVVSAWALTALLAAVLLAAPLRWQVTAALWLVISQVATVALLATRPPASEEQTGAPLAGRDVLRAIALAIFVMPVLLLFAQTLGAALIGPLLVRLDYSAVDPSALAGRFMLGLLWTVPAGAIFAVVSLRRRAVGDADWLLRAALAWLFVLLLLSTIVGGATGALERLMLPAELSGGWGASRSAMLHLAFAVLAVPLALWLAHGRGLLRPLATTTGLVLAALGSLAILLGMTPMLHFAMARAWERAGRPEAALNAYARSLRSRATPLIESYVQYRIGMLQYMLGREDRAAAAFRLVQASRNGNAQLVHTSAVLLDRLATGATGRRVVLPGIAGATEHRAAYCAPNTLARVLGYWGSPAGAATIGEQVAYIGFGTSGSGIFQACWSQGFEHLLVPFATPEDLHWLIDNRIPALIYTPGHVLSVFGYDTRLGTFVTYDTAQWDIWVDQPVADLLEPWSREWFQLGVVLPAGDDSPSARAARERFETPSARAALSWWLANEAPGPDERRALLRAALLADPSFFPAAFDLAYEGERAWLDEHVSAATIAERAWRFLERPHAPAAEVAASLADWLLAYGRHTEVLRLAEQMERRGQLDCVRESAGRAAFALGEWQRAAFLLSAAEPSAASLAERARSEIALGHLDAAASTITALVADDGHGDDAETAVRLAESLVQASPKLLESAYMMNLRDPFEAERQLRLARSSFAMIDDHGERASRRERIQRVRRSATIARVLAATEEQRVEATALLASLETLNQPVAPAE